MSIHEEVHNDAEGALHDDFADTAYQGCYIFEPSNTTSEHPLDRPAKRRRVSKPVKFPHGENPLFPSLSRGNADATLLQGRHETFEALWSHQEQRINEVVNYVNSSSLRDIVHFVKQASPSGNGSHIPTGLVITGPNYSIQERLLAQWKSSQISQSAEEVIILDSSQAPNLTTALKNIIRSVIVQRNGLEWYQSFLQGHRRLIPMNYDLELLQTFVEREKITKIVLSILDVEVFDVGSLAELIAALSSWIDRLPIVLLFGIATTAELFEARLPKATNRLLMGRPFDISPQEDSLYLVYRTAQDNPETKLFLGPALSKILLGRSKDQDESPESFARSVRYLYMSHFFANPVSVLLGDAQSVSSSFKTGLCVAIRNTNSFRDHIENILETKDPKSVTRLLDDDDYLWEESIKAVVEGQQLVLAYRRAVQDFVKLHNVLQPFTKDSLSAFDVDVRVYSGTEFLESDLYNNTLSAIERLPSDSLKSLLPSWRIIDPHLATSVTSTITSFGSLHEASAGNAIRSVHDPNHSTASTTISRNNTVSLSKHAPKLSKLEKEYTALVDKLLTTLTDYFEANIIDTTTLFMHETFVYDLKMPLAAVFTPRPRYAIERAFDRPADYLGCECCQNTQTPDGMRGEMLPPTGLLWQLWCEAGNIFNLRDLWEAFMGVVVDREEDKDEADNEGDVEVGIRKRVGKADKDNVSIRIDERRAMALFYQGLAELRMLGFVKPTKKKVDCLAKVAWRGL